MSKITYKKLSKDDDVHSFDCGSNEWEIEVSDFLIEDALNQQAMGLNVTWLFYRDDELVAYTSLISSDLTLEDTSESTPTWKSLLGLSEIEREDVPCILVGQCGVSKKFHRQRIGRYVISWICGSAFKSYYGVKLLTLHVDRKNKKGREFWKSQGFVNFPPSGGGKQLFMVFDLYGENERESI